MKIAVLSDIHGNSTALEAVMADLASKQIDKVIFLGDLFNGGPDPAGCLKLVRQLNPLVWIKGNTDDWIDDDPFVRRRFTGEEAAFIKGLPIAQTIEAEGVQVLCVHGTPRDSGERLLPDMEDAQLEALLSGYDASVVLSGHIHEPYVVNRAHRLLVNPGSIGLCNAGDDDKASYAILEISNGAVHAEIARKKFSHGKAAELAEKSGMANPDKFMKKVRHRPARLT